MTQLCVESIGVPATIKFIRSKVGLDQQEFADALGVSKSTVTNWENGVNDIPTGKLAAAAKLAGFSMTIESVR